MLQSLPWCSSYKAFILTIFLASNQLFFILSEPYFAASKMPHQFFFEFAWNWSSVLTGCNDESFFHVCTSFGLSHGFKLMETHKVAMFSMRWL